MLISDSLGSKINKNYLKNIAASHMQFKYEFVKNRENSFDSLLNNFIENLQDWNSTSCYQRDLTRFLKTSDTNVFLTVLHSIISNQQFIDLRSNALYSFSHALKLIKKMQLLNKSDFFTKDIIDFYSQLLFDCDFETELFSLSIINSILFENFEDSQSILLEYDLPALLIEGDQDLISPLFVSLSKVITPNNMEFLYKNGFIDEFLQKLLSLVASKSIETSSNSMESIILLLQNQDCIHIDDLDSLKNDLVHNLYSEDERCIELSLKLMMMLDLPPLGRFDMIYIFVESRWVKISIEAIRLIQHFLDFLDPEDQEEAKDVLLSALDENAFRIEYESVMVLISSSLFSLLNIDEKKVVLELLINYLNDEELQEEILKAIIIFFQDDQEENSVLFDIITQEYTLFEDLTWSGNENVVKYAQQILSLVDSLSDDQ